MTYRLLALDLDGTLLDPAGVLSDAAREAVAAARRAGLQVVLCTGRRYRTTLPMLRELELSGAVVVNNGAVVKDAATGKTLYQHYLPEALYPEALALLREHGSPLVYVDAYPDETDFLTQRAPEPHPYQLGYLEDHDAQCRYVEDLAEHARQDVIMLSLMADDATLLPLRERAAQRFGPRIHTHLIHNKNYEGYILELFSPQSGKWAGLVRVAAEAGIAPSEIAAVGDDANDAGLLRGAGLGIAMGNAVAEAREAANLVVAGNDADGVVEAIERVLLAG